MQENDIVDVLNEEEIDDSFKNILDSNENRGRSILKGS